MKLLILYMLTTNVLGSLGIILRSAPIQPVLTATIVVKATKLSFGPGTLESIYEVVKNEG